MSVLNDEIDLLYEFLPNEIHAFIGADVTDILCTGKMKQLETSLMLKEACLAYYQSFEFNICTLLK